MVKFIAPSVTKVSKIYKKQMTKIIKGELGSIQKTCCRGNVDKENIKDKCGHIMCLTKNMLETVMSGHSNMIQSPNR